MCAKAFTPAGTTLPAEEIPKDPTASEDVPEIAEDILNVGETANSTHPTQSIVSMGVVNFSLFRIAQDFVRLGSLFEEAFSLLVTRIFVRMVFEGHLSIRFFYLRVTRIPIDSKNIVVIPWLTSRSP